MTLNELTKGRVARVAGFHGEADLEAKLREIGFAEDDEVELLQRGPLGGAPLSIRLNRTIIALRAVEAAAIQITVAQ